MDVVRPRPMQGVFEKQFWDHIQRREFKLQRCSKCGSVRFPPGPVCHKCQSADFTWSDVNGKGRLVSWTVFHRQYFPDFPVPYTVVSGALDEGPLLITNLIGDQAQPLRLDMPLRLTFEDARSKDGDWLIYQWKPA